MEHAQQILQNLREMLQFFNCPHDPTELSSAFCIKDYSGQPWYYNLQGRSYYRIQLEGNEGYYYYPLRRGKCERYFAGSYHLFVRIWESYGVKSYDFAIYDQRDCIEDKCQRV